MPNPTAIIRHAIAQAELEQIDRKHRTELHRKLNAILAKLAERDRRMTITWTKCSDQLPDDETTVLIALADKDVYVGFRWQGEWLYLDGMPLSAGMVTHWAHLPTHPE